MTNLTSIVKQFTTAVVCILMCLTIAPAAAKTIKIIDGDTMAIGDEQISLVGIDALELEQNCIESNEVVVACGVIAAQALQALVLNEHVMCQIIASDEQGEVLAKCATRDIPDVGAQLVLLGLAVATTDQYGNDYILAEFMAQRRKQGIWATDFMRPEIYRAEANRLKNLIESAKDLSKLTVAAN